jgi:hypothetical protein
VTLIVNAPAAADTVRGTRAEYSTASRSLRLEATSTNNTATLQAFVTSSNQLIGTLSNAGGGKYKGDFSWPVNPVNVRFVSSLGGTATMAVTVK